MAAKIYDDVEAALIKSMFEQALAGPCSDRDWFKHHGTRDQLMQIMEVEDRELAQREKERERAAAEYREREEKHRMLQKERERACAAFAARLVELGASAYAVKRVVSADGTGAIDWSNQDPAPWLKKARAVDREGLASRGVAERELRNVFDVDPNNTDAVKAARDWVESDEHFLVLYGGVGSGKTTAAASIVAGSDKAALMVTAADLRKHFSYDNESQKALARLKNVSVLVIDDLGTEFADSSGFYDQNLNDLIDHRYRSCLRTVITCNIHPKDFKKRWWRIFDRISESGTYYAISGPSLRCAPPKQVTVEERTEAESMGTRVGANSRSGS